MPRLKLSASGSSNTSKPPSDAEPSYVSKNIWLSGLQTTLNVLKDVVDKIPGTPGLQEGVKGLLVICETVQKTSQNAEDIDSLSGRINKLAEILGRYTTNGDLPLLQPMQDRIDRMTQVWKKSSEKVGHIRSKNYAKRLISRDDDARMVTGEVANINSSIQNFIAESVMAIEYALDDLTSKMGLSTSRIEREIGFARQDLQEIKMRQDILPRAIAARFDAYGHRRSLCHENTRVDVLDRIDQWVECGKSLHSESNVINRTISHSDRIFWLNGPGSAGTGKTTIAFTVSTKLYKQGILGATFFCSRTGDCSNPQMIFPTIAYQLGVFYPPFKEAVHAILREDPDLVYSNLLSQLEKLLVEPLEALRGQMPFCIVVLDALDECRNDGATSDILSALARFITRLVPVQFLVTSRPDPHIARAFKLEEALKSSTERYILHLVERPVVAKDITVFLEASLRKRPNVDASWPSPAAIEALVHLSSGLFIFAATATKFILDPKYVSPELQLAKLIGAMAPTKSSSHQLLDDLYLQVLQTAFPAVSSELSSCLKTVLGSIALACDPLSRSHLEQLLNLTTPLLNILEALESILIVPQRRQDPISLIHASFRDFLVDPARCKDQHFLVKPQLQHTLLAKACFESMGTLRQNACNITETWKLHHEHGEAFSDLVLRNIPLGLQYGCRFWAQHLTHALISGQLLDTLAAFCETALLFWLEACCLLGALHDALAAAKVGEKILLASDSVPEHSVTLLHDLQRLGQLFSPLLNVASGHIYTTLPAFIPTNSPLLSSYSQYFNRSIRLLPESSRAQQWDACLSVIVGHQHPVTFAALSPNEDTIVSGGTDGTLSFWDGSTGSHLKDIRAHSNAVTCLAYSHDGAFLLSGSRDSTVKMWNTSTRELLYTMQEHHKYECNSVAFAYDRSFIVAAYENSALRVWRPWSRETHPWLYEETLRRPDEHRGSARIFSVACSPDNRYIASGGRPGITVWHNAPVDDESYGASRVWKHQSRLKFQENSEQVVTTVAFSHGGSKLVSGSFEDHTVRLWDIKTGTQIRKLVGHLNYVTSVGFSPDDKQILSSSSDKSIRIWDIRTGKQSKMLVGHSSSVSSATFAGWGTRVISTSHDKTLRIWDALVESNIAASGSGKHDRIITLACSPDGTRVAAATENCMVHLYDASTGLQLFLLKKHSKVVNSLDISSNNQFLASGSSDATVCIWNMSNGACQKVISGQTVAIHSVKFLRDNASVLLGSLDGSVQIWSGQTGKHTSLLQAHQDEVRDVAISPDGKFLASACEDKSIHLWHSDQPSRSQLLNGHDGSVSTIAFSTNSEYLASASRDCACIWSANDGSLLQMFDSGCSKSARILFSADQQYITLGSLCVPTGLHSAKPPSATAFHYSNHAGYYMEDGWILHVNSQRRVCWVPQSHRGMMVACKNGVALTTSFGDKFVVLDFTALETWEELAT